jgi:phosphosulfolactate synthase
MFFKQLWSKELKDPSGSRGSKKPRTTGLTMVIDRGVGLDSFSDYLQLHAGYIDFVKLEGAASLYPPSILKKKSDEAKLCQVELYLDGILLCVALKHNQLQRYVNSLHQLEIHTIELQQQKGLEQKKRTELIKELRQQGFKVFSTLNVEGVQSSDFPDEIKKQTEEDLKAGTSLFSFTNYPGILPLEFLKGHIGLERFIFPADTKEQQLSLLRAYGNDVNISHIKQEDVLSIEALRRGLYQKQEDWKIINEN